MKIISLIGRKGGITKTTLADNLAAGAALRGLRVVLVDADGQANTCRLTGVKPEPGFYNLILGESEFADVLKPVKPAFLGGAGELYVLPTDDSQRVVEQDKTAAALILERFEELNGWADLVLVDTSPGITEVHAAFYLASDYVLLPTTLDYLGITSLQSTMSYLASAAGIGAADGLKAADLLGIVPNCFAASEKVQQANVGYLRGKYESQCTVFSPLRSLTVWKQAAQMRQSIYAYRPEDDYNARRQSRIAANELQPVLDAVLSVCEVVTA